MYVSVNRFNIGLDNGVLPIWRQAIIFKPMLGYCQLDP